MPNISDDAFKLQVRFWGEKWETKMCALSFCLWVVSENQKSYILAKKEGLLEMGLIRNSIWNYIVSADLFLHGLEVDVSKLREVEREREEKERERLRWADEPSGMYIYLVKKDMKTKSNEEGQNEYCRFDNRKVNPTYIKAGRHLNRLCSRGDI